MKSLRELRTELTGVRIAATSHSLWNLVATVDERARQAINDAIRIYPFYVEELYTSISPTQRVSIVPRNVDRIIELNAISPSSGKVVGIGNYRYMPTAITCMISVNAMPSDTDSDAYIELHYQSRLSEFPEDVWLFTALEASIKELTSTSGSPVSYWKSPGYAELTNADRSAREVIKYDLALTNGFTNIVRAVVGEDQAWPAGTRISAVAPVSDEGVAVIQAAAEANMYAYWIAHRSQYAQYTAIASLEQSDLSDVVTLIRVLDERAERRRAKMTLPSKPTFIRRV